MRTTDYIGKNFTNWFYVRLNKFKRSLNSTTRKFKLLILLEILGAWRPVPSGSLNSEPDQNAIFYNHFQTWFRSLTSMAGVTNAMHMFTYV